jgi:uncharacterized protein
MRDIKDFDLLTLPGWQSSGPDHWQSHWERAFGNMRRVEQDDWETPRYAEWSRRLGQEVARCRRPILLIAHSLGTSLVMRWASEQRTDQIAGAFLVAPTDRDQLEDDPASPAHGFGPMLTDPLPFPAMVLASRNDELVSLERARRFAEDWEASFVDVGALGHIGSVAKLGLWPQGLVWLGQFIASL